MKKERLLYLIPHLQKSGPVEQLRSLIKNIDDNKYDVYIVTLFKERQNSLLSDFQNLGCRVIQLNCSYYNLIRQRYQLKKTIQKITPDIIHSNSVFTDIAVKGNSDNHKLVITQHNYIYEDLIPKYGRAAGTILALLEKKAILYADTVVACSNTLKNKYKKIINGDIVAIPNGIDIDEWNCSYKGKNELRNDLGIPENKHVFLSTGLLIKRKNPVLVIDAFLQSKCHDSVLVMLGDGDCFDECKKRAGSSSNIIFKGRVNNVKDYLFAADTFISASSSEGLPYAVMEAECTGIKMILSDIPQHYEVGAGEDIDYFDINNKQSLIQLLIDNSKHEERIKYNLDRISAKSMADGYMKLYESLAER